MRRGANRAARALGASSRNDRRDVAILRADEALYSAKELGRDCVVCHTAIGGRSLAV
jgi:GGDEF domain-containing protein